MLLFVFRAITASVISLFSAMRQAVQFLLLLNLNLFPSLLHFTKVTPPPPTTCRACGPWLRFVLVLTRLRRCFAGQTVGEVMDYYLAKLERASQALSSRPPLFPTKTYAPPPTPVLLSTKKIMMIIVILVKNFD